eukprot:SAG31_NODE_12322_length_949_cov_1.834118_1_plen_40_part_10
MNHRKINLADLAAPDQMHTIRMFNFSVVQRWIFNFSVFQR